MASMSKRADEVLAKAKPHGRRSTPACYPCYKRKVRCEGGRPCQACVERGHSDICHDDGGPRKRPKRDPGGRYESRTLADNSRTGRSATSHTTRTDRSDLTTAATPQSVEPSGRDVIQRNLQDGRNLLPGNLDCHDEPLDNSNTVAGPQSQTWSDMLPHQSEIFRFFPPFRDIVMNLYGIVTEVATLESSIYALLATRPVYHDEDSQNDKVTLAQVAMILACLALGCQFAELDAATRQDLSQDLINRSNKCLQEGNFTLSPSVEVVQALLLIGLAQQNLEQSDAAWMLLGLTHRLAQTLGLNRPQITSGDGSATHHLWQAILWQDVLLSLRYNRQLLSYDVDNRPARQNLSYIGAMNEICAITRELLAKPAVQASESQRRTQLLRKIEEVRSHCCDHLRLENQARTLQQRTEHKLLQLHTNFLSAEICRPSFTADPNDHTHQHLCREGMKSLQQCLRAFLDLCQFSRFPLRSWSITQSILSSAFLLATTLSKANDPVIRQLLRNVSDALWTDTSPPLANKEVRKPCVGLSVTRMKASKLLLCILDGPVGDETPSNLESDSVNALSAETRDVWTASLDLNEWPSELSLFDPTFAAGILDFDPDPAWLYNAS